MFCTNRLARHRQLGTQNRRVQFQSRQIAQHKRWFYTSETRSKDHLFPTVNEDEPILILRIKTDKGPPQHIKVQIPNRTVGGEQDGTFQTRPELNGGLAIRHVKSYTNFPEVGKQRKVEVYPWKERKEQVRLNPRFQSFTEKIGSKFLKDTGSNEDEFSTNDLREPLDMKGSCSERIATTFCPELETIERKPKRNKKKLMGSNEYEFSADVLRERLDMERGCSEKIATILYAELEPSENKPTRNKEKLICSYNYDDSGNLYIPGAPPRYQQPTLPLQIKPSLSFSPVWKSPTMWAHLTNFFETVETMRPSFDFSKIDVVCTMRTLITLSESLHERANLGGLSMRFIRGTLLMDTLELRTNFHEDRAKTTLRKGFMAAVTSSSNGVPLNSQYVRWIRYNIGNLSCAVLVEADAWEKDLRWDPGETALKPSEPYPSKYVAGKLVSKVGYDIPGELLVILTMRKLNLKSRNRVAESYFGRLETFIDGCYIDPKVAGATLQSKGQAEPFFAHTIQQLRRYRPRKRFSRWRIRESLPKLVTLLERLRATTAQSKSHACIAFSTGSGSSTSIEVHEPEFDEDILDERRVPHKYRVPAKFLSTSIEQRFWPGGEEVLEAETLEGMGSREN